MFFFFKQKTAYEMRISDWSSDVCSSDLEFLLQVGEQVQHLRLDRDVERRHRLVEHHHVGVQHQGAGNGDALALPAGEHVRKIGRAHVRTPVTNAHLVCRLLLEKKKKKTSTNNVARSTKTNQNKTQ